MKNSRVVEKIGLVLVAVLALYFVSYTTYSDFSANRRQVLFYQLQILRMGVNIHQLVERRNPASLRDLVANTYKLPRDIAERHFVEGIPADARGRICDPFGNPYHYDPMTGWVRSVTKGYEFW